MLRKYLLLVFLLFNSIYSNFAFGRILPSEVANLINRSGVLESELSIWIQALDASKPLVELNGDVMRTPASVAKILTTSAALLQFGGDHHFQTRFYSDNFPNAAGILEGNLYVKGGGDPFLVEERLQEALAKLYAKGVHHISGAVVLDDSLYELSALESDSNSFDGMALQPYNAVPHPLMVNFRTIRIVLAVTKKGNIKVNIYPPIDSWKKEIALKINNLKCGDGYNPHFELQRQSNGFATLRISGSISRNCAPREEILALGEASEQFYYLLRELWTQKIGGTIDGGGELRKVPSSAKLLLVSNSLPLAQLVQKINQVSNNVMSRQLFLLLGAQKFGSKVSLARSRLALLQTLQQFGLDTQNIFIENGSGLSRRSKVSVHQLGKLLILWSRANNFGDFFHSLAVAGETGTLKKRFKNTSLSGQIVGKTGTIEQVRSFAGYVRAASGRNYVVVIIGNGKTAIKSRQLQDKLLQWVFKQ